MGHCSGHLASKAERHLNPLNVVLRNSFGIVEPWLRGIGVCEYFARQGADRRGAEHHLFQRQTYNVYIDGSVYDQTVKQNTSIAAQTGTKSSAGVQADTKLNEGPMTLNYAYNLYSDNSQKQVTSITEGLSENQITTQNGWPIYFSSLNVSENPGDTLNIDPNGVATPTNQTNSERYTYFDSNLTCWGRTVKANGGTLTSYKDGCGK